MEVENGRCAPSTPMRPALTSGINAGAGFVPTYLPSADLDAYVAHYPDYKLAYAADDSFGGDNPRWRPSIHMKRWASRLTLEITELRVERLNAITEAGAITEGVTAPWMGSDRWDYKGPTTHYDAYRILWNSLNESRGYGWDVNPWVWVISFCVVGSQGDTSR